MHRRRRQARRAGASQQRVAEDKLAQLAEDIAHKVSEELTFPGQVKITVIREFRAVEVAA